MRVDCIAGGRVDCVDVLTVLVDCIAGGRVDCVDVLTVRVDCVCMLDVCAC